MDDTKRQTLAGLLVGLVPANVLPIGSQRLRGTLVAKIRERGCP